MISINQAERGREARMEVWMDEFQTQRRLDRLHFG